jgi:hypothetical protein
MSLVTVDSVLSYQLRGPVMSRTLSKDEQYQMLERLAHQAWIDRGRPLGSPEVDWDQAVTILNTQLTLVNEQPLGGEHETFSELGNDEDTPADSLSISPFDAAQSQSTAPDHADFDRSRLDGAADAAKLTTAENRSAKRGKRAPRK